MLETIFIALGIVLRIAVPAVMTLIVTGYLKSLDEKWRREGLEAASRIRQTRLEIPAVRCWDIRNCSAKQRENCPAYLQQEPCWEIHRVQGRLKSTCLRCPVVQKALLPAGV